MGIFHRSTLSRWDGHIEIIFIREQRLHRLIKPISSVYFLLAKSLRNGRAFDGATRMKCPSAKVPTKISTASKYNSYGGGGDEAVSIVIQYSSIRYPLYVVATYKETSLGNVLYELYLRLVYYVRKT